MSKNVTLVFRKDHWYDPTARAVVANLGWRWLAARRRGRLIRKRFDYGEVSVTFAQAADSTESEAWNAFEVSRRILYGGEL